MSTKLPKEREEYSFEKKKKLATKISDMRNKIHLRKIKEIIFTNNPGISAKKDSGGYLMFFQNYTNDTYYEIEKYLNKIEREKLEQQTRSITETSDQLIMSSEDPASTTDYSTTRTRLRYSNREKRLIKRQQYENILSQTIIDSDTNEQDDDSTDSITEKQENIKKIVKKTPKTLDNIALDKIVNNQSDNQSDNQLENKSNTKADAKTDTKVDIKADTKVINENIKPSTIKKKTKTESLDTPTIFAKINK